MPSNPSNPSPAEDFGVVPYPHIKKLRKEKKWTQQDLVENSGVSLSTVQRMERGVSVSMFSIRSVMDALEQPERRPIALGTPPKGAASHNDLITGFNAFDDMELLDVLNRVYELLRHIQVRINASRYHSGSLYIRLDMPIGELLSFVADIDVLKQLELPFFVALIPPPLQTDAPHQGRLLTRRQADRIAQLDPEEWNWLLMRANPHIGYIYQLHMTDRFEWPRLSREAPTDFPNFSGFIKGNYHYDRRGLNPIAVLLDRAAELFRNVLPHVSAAEAGRIVYEQLNPPLETSDIH
ncbi:MAG: helix-turn-helix domain-containing protein [Pirellulaceae bacterium]